MIPARSDGRDHDADADEGVLTPEELQLDDDRVDELGENRYVIRPDPGAGAGKSTAMVGLDAVPGEPLDPDRTAASFDATASRSALAAAPEPHGIDVTLKTDGELAHLRTTSNDVREVFRELLTWYADQLDDDLTPAQALEVMLRTTELEA